MDISSTPDVVSAPHPRRKLSAIGVTAHVVIVPNKEEATEDHATPAPPAAVSGKELEHPLSAKKRPRPTLALQRIIPDENEAPVLYEDSSIIINQTATPDTPYLDDPLYGRFYLGHGKFAFWPTVWFIFSPFYPGSMLNWNEGTLCGRAMQLPSVNRDKAHLLARQLCSFSSAMVIVQVLLLVVMCNVVTVPLHLNNLWGPSALTLTAFGACNADLVVYRGEWQRLFVPLFLHAGIIEAVILGVLLLRLGALLEFRWGTLHCVLAYVITGVHGLTTSAAQYPLAVSVGAYVAIAGLLGVWLSEQAGMFLMGRGDLTRPQQTIELGMCIGSMVIVLLFATLGSFHDASAPASAFLAGILYAMAALWSLPEHDPRPRMQFIIRAVASLCLFAVCTYSLVYLYMYAPIPSAPRRKLQEAHA